MGILRPDSFFRAQKLTRNLALSDSLRFAAAHGKDPHRWRRPALLLLAAEARFRPPRARQLRGPAPHQGHDPKGHHRWD